MTKKEYLVISKQRDCDCPDQIELDFYNTPEGALNHIIRLKACGKKRGTEFVRVLEVKEIVMTVPQDRVDAYVKEEEEREAKKQEEFEIEQERSQRALFERLREKYETKRSNKKTADELLE